MKIHCAFIVMTSMLIGSYTSIYADEIKITASVDKTKLELGDCIQYRIKIHGTLDKARPRLPQLEEFSLRYGPQISIGTEVEEDGVSVYQGFIFGLVPLKTGKHTIGPSTFLYKSKVYKTRTFEIEVTERTPF